MKSYDAVALFSGGLDSILAARLVQEQGLAVKCLHFISPFFGSRDAVPHWRQTYGLDIDTVDISEAFVAALFPWPAHGFGKAMNPCIDCKIGMLREAARLLERYGASFIISGEVLGQRPMSQRRDALHVILRDAGVRDILLRPLCALHMAPTEAERSGKVDRSRLLAISGRGRTQQMELAQRFGLTEVPTPGGGCRLAEVENARRYWPVFRRVAHPRAADFRRAGTGRQYWSFADTPLWLRVGRNKADNECLLADLSAADHIFKLADFPGPIAIGRQLSGKEWQRDAMEAAAAFAASFSPKARRHVEETGKLVTVRVYSGADGLDGPSSAVAVTPDRTTCYAWKEYAWPQARAEIREEQKARTLSGPCRAAPV